MKLSRFIATILSVVAFVSFAAAEGLFPPGAMNVTVKQMKWKATTYSNVNPFDDVRFGIIKSKMAFSPELLQTLTFNRSTRWSAATSGLANRIMDRGANPGLGVRELHAQGITGSGVTIAIIDQNLAGEHPEFAGKIVKYVDIGCDQDADSGSMHGPAVTSLLVGTNLGTARGASVFYFAVPSWELDSEYYAKALDQIMEENTRLPVGKKIRAVSVSAAPSGSGSPCTKNQQLWDVAVAKAALSGILVLDCTTDRGFVSPGNYNPENPESLDKFSPGWPGEKGPVAARTNTVYAPTSFRTVAEEYVKGEPSYQYTGRGGLSWGIPYVTGVAALAWQVNPNLTGEQMKALLIDTAFRTSSGACVVDARSAVSAAKARTK